MHDGGGLQSGLTVGDQLLETRKDGDRKRMKALGVDGVAELDRENAGT